jgi:hypothetical protein
MLTSQCLICLVISFPDRDAALKLKERNYRIILSCVRLRSEYGGCRLYGIFYRDKRPRSRLGLPDVRKVHTYPLFVHRNLHAKKSLNLKLRHFVLTT